jgi:hypothetical protein
MIPMDEEEREKGKYPDCVFVSTRFPRTVETLVLLGNSQDVN